MSGKIKTLGGYSLAGQEWVKEIVGIDHNTFKREYMCIPVIECSVQDNNGKHCPDKPEHYFEHNGKEVGLCNRCYLNYKAGEFDPAKRKLRVYTSHKVCNR